MSGQAFSYAAPATALAGERRLLMSGLAVIGLTFGVFGTWATSSPLSGAVIVSGHVAVESERKTVQHQEGGIIKRILVKPGSIVTQGETLLELESVQVEAVAAATRSQRDAELARAARLAAERDYSARYDVPAELQSRAHKAEVAQVIAAEQNLFDSRRRTLSQRIALLRAENVHVRKEIASLQAQELSANVGVGYARQLLALNAQLVREKFVSQARLLELQARVSDRELQGAQATAAVAQAFQKIKQNELRIEGLRRDYADESANELRLSERRIEDLRQRLRPDEDTLARLTIVAPIAGEVVDLKVHTVGGVIASREPLMSIVPANAPLIVKGKARTEDIIQLATGAEAAVQLLAYKRRTTPVVTGRLIYVSADMLTEQIQGQPAPYYEVRISIDKTELAKAGDLAIMPGMPVDAFIRTESRTLLEYLMQPITQAMRRAGRQS